MQFGRMLQHRQGRGGDYSIQNHNTPKQYATGNWGVPSALFSHFVECTGNHNRDNPFDML